jgi:hypothetical protein
MELHMDIDYGKCNVPLRIETEIETAYGTDYIKLLKENELLFDDSMSEDEKTIRNKNLVNRIIADHSIDSVKEMFVKVRHDLSVQDFKWAIMLFKQYNDIHKFAIALQNMERNEIKKCYAEGKDFFGMKISEEVIHYIDNDPYIFYGIPVNGKIIARAIPAKLDMYLNESNNDMKRFYACHCEYARRSILDKGNQVSSMFCNCSLGHTMVLWEAVLSTKLNGRVVKSALNGDCECVFEIDLP